MHKEIKAEFIKEKRSANQKLLFLVPVIFIVFNLLMGMLMGGAPDGKSILVATAFNWYPILILPIVLSLLVININKKEKSHHIIREKSLGLNRTKIIIAKNIIVLIELFMMLCISTLLIYVLGTFLLHDSIKMQEVLFATICLFVGSLPIVGISFIMVSKRVLVIMGNFIFTLIPAAIIAVSKWWVVFPWSYNLRMVTPVVGVHPNGTFLNVDSPLMDINATIIGIGISFVVYLLTVLVQISMERRNSNV